MKKWILIAALVTLGALSASAGWKVVAEVTAGGDAKELAVNRTIRTVQIECTDGTVVVNTVVIVKGCQGAHHGCPSFQQGRQAGLGFGRSRNVTGLRISDSGKGRYKVHAK